MKSVSIYLNVYNAEKLIKETVNSILNQSYRNLKLVVIDDCSTDKTVEVLKSINDARLEIHSLYKNSHIATALNEGLKYMDGDYIAHCDSDDLWEPDKLQKQVDFLENNPEYGACFTYTYFVNDRGELDNSLFPLEIYNIKNMSQAELLNYFCNFSNHFNHSSFFARKEIVKELGLYDVSMPFLHDYDYWLRLITLTPVYVLEEPLTKVRIRENSNSKMNEKKWNSHNAEYKRAIENCIRFCPQELFLKAFKDDLKLTGEHTPEETIIEKAFVLEKITTPLYYNPVMAVEAFSRIVNDEKLSKIAEDKFGFLPKSLYKLEETKEFSCSNDKIFYERIESLTNDISQKDSTINSLNGKIDELSREVQNNQTTIKNLSSEINDKNTIIENMSNEIKNRDHTINDFKNSFFWRITKIPRFFVQKIKDFASKRRRLRVTLIVIKSFLVAGPKGVKRKLQDLKMLMPASISVSHTISDKRRKYEESHKFNNPVKFSILVPLYNTPKVFLQEMIESVKNQTYKNWELCLADGSTDEFSYVEDYCLSLARKDKRIKYKKLTENKGISENTNVCLEMAKGDYIALFDHDDYLHPSALFEVMKRIDAGADFIYTDELTFLDRDFDNVQTFHYKPDFSFDNLLANNYICHFTVFKATLVDSKKLFRTKYDGSQDHDLMLRLTDKAKKIEHIPQILYFWRSHANSVAMDINSKKYAIDAGINAVRDFLNSKNYPCHVESSPAFPTIYRIKYEIKGNPKVSIIIPNKNHFSDLQRCLNSINDLSTYDNYEIIIADNQSSEPDVLKYYDEIKSNSKISVLFYNHPFNYSAMNNLASLKATGDYLLFLNNDTKVITPEWIEELLMYAQRNDVGAVGAKLLFENNTVQHGGIILGLGSDRVAGHSHYGCSVENLGYMGKMYYAQNVSAVTAACMMISKELFNLVGGFNEKLAVAYNDVDFCLKLRRIGKLNVFNPFCVLYHFESISRGLDTNSKNRERFNNEKKLFLKEWGDVIAKGDPYYNPNLSLDSSYVISPKESM